MQGSSGHFVLREISSGGMGTVELVVRRDGGFERLYALKRLLPEILASPSARGMFLDEARIAGRLRHPHVVSVHDVGEDERGPFLLMDFVEGISAQTLLAWSHNNEAPLPASVVLEVAIAAAEGLDAAHELLDADGAPMGLVHRDVSPQNILVGFDGSVRLTDFGIAKIFGQSTRTSTGVLKGKLGYMAPEQLRFDPLDRRSDLFSLGVVLFELLAGRRLYHDPDGSLTARRILREPPPDLGEEREDVSPELVGLLFEMLAKEPAHRPSTAREVADRLTTIAGEARLVGDDGPSLRQFLSTELADVREKKRAEIVEAMARLERGEVAPMPWTRTSAAPPPPVVRKGRLAIAALVVGVCATLSVAALALAWTFGGSGSGDERPAPPERPPLETEAEPPPVETAEVDPAVEPEAEPEAEARTEEPVVPRRRLARRGSMRRSRAESMQEAMVAAPPPSMATGVVSLGGLPIAPPAMSREERE